MLPNQSLPQKSAGTFVSLPHALGDLLLKVHDAELGIARVGPSRAASPKEQGICES